MDIHGIEILDDVVSQVEDAPETPAPAKDLRPVKPSKPRSIAAQRRERYQGALLRELSAAEMRTLWRGIIDDAKGCDDPKVQMACRKMVMEYAIGKPKIMNIELKQQNIYADLFGGNQPKLST